MPMKKRFPKFVLETLVRPVQTSVFNIIQHFERRDFRVTWQNLLKQQINVISVMFNSHSCVSRNV